MKDKYYTPTIEEFHIGFEYEIAVIDNNWTITNWKPSKIETFTDLNRIEEYPQYYRVKYLDQEDLIELGFNKVEPNKRKLAQPLYDKYTKRLKSEGMFENNDTLLDIKLLQSGNINIDYEIFSSWGGSKRSFGISIKNKSALKKLLTNLHLG